MKRLLLPMWITNRACACERQEFTQARYLVGPQGKVRAGLGRGLNIHRTRGGGGEVTKHRQGTSFRQICLSR